MTATFKAELQNADGSTFFMSGVVPSVPSPPNPLIWIRQAVADLHPGVRVVEYAVDTDAKLPWWWDHVE